MQFTSDLLPSDIIGVSVYERERSAFKFHPGPLFAQLVLADEINRATPKTQSALLEAMAEQQVTVDGVTHARCRRRSSSSRRRIRSISPAPIRCPIRSSTVSCCASAWTIRIAMPSARC